MSDIKQKEKRFSLWFDSEKEKFVIVVSWDFINEYIFKDENGKWELGYGLNAHNIEKTENGHSFNFGMPTMNFLATFEEWKKLKHIQIESVETGKKYELPEQDLDSIKMQIKLRDKRIKFN